METFLTTVICQFSFSNRIKHVNLSCGSLCNPNKLKASESVLETWASLCSIVEAMQKTFFLRKVIFFLLKSLFLCFSQLVCWSLGLCPLGRIVFETKAAWSCKDMPQRDLITLWTLCWLICDWSAKQKRRRLKGGAVVRVAPQVAQLQKERKLTFFERRFDEWHNFRTWRPSTRIEMHDKGSHNLVSLMHSDINWEITAMGMRETQLITLNNLLRSDKLFAPLVHRWFIRPKYAWGFFKFIPVHPIF